MFALNGSYVANSIQAYAALECNLVAARDASAVLLLRSTHLGLHTQTAISNFNYAYQGLVWCVKYLLFFVEVPC